MKDFKEKTTFITGGSTGIGLAIANAFAQGGSDVVIFARTVSKLEAAVNEIASHKISQTQKVSFYNCDTSNYSEVQTVFKKAIGENGEPDILINCVGIAQPGYFEEISFDSFDHTIKTNLYSTWNVCSAVVPFMKKNGGQILNTSSIAGFVGVFGYTDYCMAKAGIIGFSEALRSELKPYNIFVSVLCPPDTDTPGLQTENATKPKETIAISGNARLLKPEFVAQEVLKYLPSKKLLIIPGMDGKFTLLLKRFFPSLVEWFMDRTVKKSQQS